MFVTPPPTPTPKRSECEREVVSDMPALELGEEDETMVVEAVCAKCGAVAPTRMEVLREDSECERIGVVLVDASSPLCNPSWP